MSQKNPKKGKRQIKKRSLSLRRTHLAIVDAQANAIERKQRGRYVW